MINVTESLNFSVKEILIRNLQKKDIQHFSFSKNCPYFGFCCCSTQISHPSIQLFHEAQQHQPTVTAYLGYDAILYDVWTDQRRWHWEAGFRHGEPLSDTHNNYINIIFTERLHLPHSFDRIVSLYNNYIYIIFTERPLLSHTFDKSVSCRSSSWYSQ